MITKPAPPKTMDEYIASAPPGVRDTLQKIRMTIRKAAPEAQETIKYQMPTFTLNGNLISFAANKKHIGLYPAPEGDAEFNRRLSPYKAEKSTVRLPLDQPIPLDLVTEIVELLVKDNMRRKQDKLNRPRKR